MSEFEKRLSVQVVVIGGGAAGMAAAVSAYDAGAKDVAIIELSERLGGVLPQCIHSGFGLMEYGVELTGPEYSAKLEKEVNDRGIRVLLNCPVTKLNPGPEISAVSDELGPIRIVAGSAIMATGCRERPAGAIDMGGQRPAGVMTAGLAQRYINIEGYMVGKKAVILGSGDIGLIMARRLTLEGAEVVCVCEIMPYSNGLKRNIVQCLEDYNIPLRLSSTVVAVEGRERVRGVWIAPVEEDTLAPRLAEKEFVECDTLLLSVGLIPETGLARNAGAELGKNRGLLVDQHRAMTLPGYFACGNVVQVHDLADLAAQEGRIAGESAALYVLGKTKPQRAGEILLSPGKGISYIVPERVRLPAGKTELFFRVNGVFRNSKLTLESDDNIIAQKRRSIMLPGEMERLNVDLSEIDSGELTLNVEKA